MKNIVILISGRGSNMQAIVDADIPGARIAAVIANRPDAAGLAWAAARGIATVGLDHKQFASREAFDERLAAEIDAFAPDLVVLAGFMRILTPAFTARYEGRMMNIHPSLLPSFPGLHTHQRAIDMGCKVAGCTVHFVTAELDHGPIVAQAVVPVLDDDTETTLAARVLQQEHRLYPEAVRRFAAGELQIRNGRIGGVDAAAAGLALQVPVL
ncbi:formyltetrahydrofolate-dependent phosphoribosylglycinamide formyltransferase [Vogesella indigofera]|uniref:Phosphoribosylglycinamide formyltransferase n=1 Tax=Vogesella indigofera TaxID=45465 RepID=A0A495BEW7_VOGIN|nr:phosphoribosylglycinamide formyltransferase [Vogesella indigofera]RKQ59063.1 formyltetrahydrofolate-dependent phosphoribosylglycinamide formyltransferase [Vogesella indigofera]